MNATAPRHCGHDCREENAPQLLDWIRTRGGLAIWGSENLSDPGKSWTCPVLGADGLVKSKPCSYATSEPIRTITDTDEVMVHQDHEVQRFHVGVRRTGPFGMTLKLTDGASRKVRAAEEKAGAGSYHVFDFDTQEAIIMAPVPNKSMSLTAWAEAHHL